MGLYQWHLLHRVVRRIEDKVLRTALSTQEAGQVLLLVVMVVILPSGTPAQQGRRTSRPCRKLSGQTACVCVLAPSFTRCGAWDLLAYLSGLHVKTQSKAPSTRYIFNKWDKNQLWEKHTLDTGSAVSCLRCINMFAMIINKTTIIRSKRTIQGTWIRTDSLAVCELGEVCELP